MMRRLGTIYAVIIAATWSCPLWHGQSEGKGLKRRGDPFGPTTKPALPKPTSEAKTTFAAVAGLYDQVGGGVVKVVGKARLGPSRVATGFFVSSDGTFVTDWHVIANPHLASVAIEIQGVILRASVLAIDEQTDVAILRTTEAMTIGHVFAGRDKAKLSEGEPLYAVGNPGPTRLSLSRGTLTAVLPGGAVAAKTDKGTRLAGNYEYVSTTAAIDGTNIGGPLIDAKGKVVGMCAFRRANGAGGYAIEWKAISDALAKAAKARPIDLEQIHKRAEAVKRELVPLETQPATGPNIGRAFNAARKSAYCYRCAGSGKIVETQMQERLVNRMAMVDGTFRKITVREQVPVEVKMTCPLCQGALITNDPNDAGQGLASLAQTLLDTDLMNPFAIRCYWNGVWVLNELAFNDGTFDRSLNVAAGKLLRNPARHVSEPVALVGYVTEVKKVPGGALVLAATDAGQSVLATCPRNPGAVTGEYCLIAGTLRGTDAALPIVVAAAIYPVHEPDPKYRTRNPNEMPTALARLASRRPTAVAPDDDGPDPLETALTRGRMYAQNNMHSKAIPILKEIVKKHPKSEQAEAALELLQKIDPAHYPKKK